MQSGARYQAVIDILTEVLADCVPADKVVADYLRSRKYIGSKDRKFITDKVWHIIRNRMKLEFDSGFGDARKLVLYDARDNLDEVFDGSAYGVTDLTDEEREWLKKENEEPYPDYVEAECPKWLFEKINNMEYCKALNEQASTDIRAHGIGREELKRRLEAEGIDVEEGGLSSKCLKIKGRLVLNNCATWQDGCFEVQDEASQIAAILADVKPEHKIIDYCCGAGGKSLAMSDCLSNQGKILAYDIDAKRLDAIKPRMARLKIKNIEITDIIAGSDKDFDRFVLDAPCSGTGTWRRAPDAKYRLTKEKLFGLNKIQSELLDIAAAKTKSGGRIIYITCSILKEENEDIIEAFVRKHPQFEPVDMKVLWESKIGCKYPAMSKRYVRMSPFETGTDGFFVCVLENKL